MQNSIISRMKNILEQDSNKKSAMINSVIKSDIFNVLKSYFELEPNNMVVDISQEGEIYTVKVLAKAQNIKGLNYLK